MVALSALFLARVALEGISILRVDLSISDLKQSIIFDFFIDILESHSLLIQFLVILHLSFLLLHTLFHGPLTLAHQELILAGDQVDVLPASLVDRHRIDEALGFYPEALLTIAGH